MKGNKMKILLLGAGGQGGPCASIMARDSDVGSVTLADADYELAVRVADKVGSPKIHPLSLDASDQGAVVRAAADVDCIIDLTPVWLGPTVIGAALKAGTNYVSTSFDVPYLDQIALGQELFLDNELRQANVKALLGCGLAPGFLNVVVRHYCDKLDTVNSVKYRLGKRKLNLGEFGDVTDPWNPGWSPKQALIDFSNPCYVFRDGKFESLPPFSEIEDFSFPAPTGNMLVSHHTHEEVVSTPVVIGKGIKYCDFKYYVARPAAAFVAMGLASQEEVEFGGGKFKPIDFIVNYVPKPGNAFFDEDPATLDAVDKALAIPSVLIIEGKSHGKPVTYTIHCPKLLGHAAELYELFGTSLISIALPSVIGAKMITEGDLHTGINLPEELDSTRFFEHFFGTGIPYTWEEDVETEEGVAHTVRNGANLG
jgi:saccharopine dehydrogenase-like NADP-dependent oxidoreductase